MNDTELLSQYIKEGSEPAFRELVARHLPVVLAAARRIAAGDAHLAQDVAQQVFTDLARKAAELPPGVVLGGWLHRHTCFAAAKAVRTESRRRARERTAMETNQLNEVSAHDEQWARLAPVLDDALNHLDAEDRDAIVLRYFEQRDLRAIGVALGTSEDTAQKRVARALEKLRAVLTRRGITVSMALLAVSLDGQVAPVVSGLETAKISAAALKGTTAAGWTTSSIIAMKESKIILGIAGVTALGLLTAIIVHYQLLPENQEFESRLNTLKPIQTQQDKAVSKAVADSNASTSTATPKANITATVDRPTASAVTVTQADASTATAATESTNLATGGKTGIHFAVAPTNISEAILTNVKTTASGARPGIRGSSLLPDGMSADMLTISKPPLEAFRLQKVSDDLSSVQSMGYEFIVDADGTQVAVAQAQLDDGGAMKVSKITYRSSMAPIGEGLEKLAALDQIKNGSYEGRVLIYPVRKMPIAVETAIWLKSDSGNGDLVYPLASANSKASTLPSGVKPNTIYSVEDFLTIIRGKALTQSPPQP